MKKRLSSIILAAAACLMLVTACSKSNDELILGTWNLAGGSSITLAGARLPLPANYLVLTFKDDGMVATAYPDSINAYLNHESPYTLDGNKVTWDSTEYTITELQKKHMILEFAQNDTADLFGEQSGHLEFDKAE